MLQVKGNQPKLRAHIAACCAQDPTPEGAWHTQRERRNGWHYTWHTRYYVAPEWSGRAEWAGLAGFVVVVKTSQRGQAPPVQHTRYYLTSLVKRPVAELAGGIRGHWGIENKLHRTRDVHFGQDGNRIRHHNGAANMAVFNTLALNYLLATVDTSVSYAQLYFSQNFKESMPYPRT